MRMGRVGRVIRCSWNWEKALYRASFKWAEETGRRIWVGVWGWMDWVGLGRVESRRVSIFSVELCHYIILLFRL